MKIETVLITPAMATELLKTNSNNRPVKEKRILKYAKDMLEGNWIAETGETIKVLLNGKLGDGQHRLMAVES